MTRQLTRADLGIADRPDAGGSAAFELRTWFVAFLAWLALLTCLALWAFAHVEGGDAGWLRVWLTAVCLFYLSLCCLFFPMPTAWCVLLLASPDVALVGSIPARVGLVAVLCAAATAAANLNEYHVLTFLLDYRRIDRLRQTRWYGRAAAWFAIAPFWTITAFSFIPIPVDVIRVLAVAVRYPRFPFAGAYFVGRFFRYGLFALSSAWLALTPLQVAIVQAVLVALAAARVVQAAVRRRRLAERRGTP